MRRHLAIFVKSAVFSALAFSGLGAAPPTAKILQTLSEGSFRSPFKNWGLFHPKAKAHIHATEAWKITEGSRNVVVAVIDTGIDPTHPLLKSNLWSNPLKEKEFGWNFVNDTPNPVDDHGHGTHVSGIIGAQSDAKAGVSGVSHAVSIMAVKYYSESADGAVNLKNTIRALNYAIDHGARIINYSGGGPEFAEEEYLAIKRAESKGVLVVAAAGNERNDTDQPEHYYYPAAYRLPNILSVAACDTNDQLLPTSNWGMSRVDLCAPGDNIYSTLPGNKAGYMTGTSQATAFVAGAAALLLADDPKLTHQELRELLSTSVDPVPSLKDKLLRGGRLNAYQALLALRARKQGTPTRPALVAQRPGSLGELLSVSP